MMHRKDRPASDVFTLALRGATTVASFAVVPVIALDRVNRKADQRFRSAEIENSGESGEWLSSHRRAA
jgi:hypothetical protein